MKEINFSDALSLRAMMLKKEISAQEVMEATINRLEETEPKINAFSALVGEKALDEAKAADAALVRGKPLGPLHGLPLSVKDLINVGGLPTTFGSRIAKDNLVEDDAPAVERARASGACIIGKTTTTEFGCKAGGGDSPLTGITRNPWNLGKTTGGSSAGAAASVSAGVTPFALGTDGGGSIRIPAAFCGLFGIKAQFGRVPVYPTSATPTLAHVGPLSRSVRDSALLLSAIGGFDNRDPFSVAQDLPDYLACCDEPIFGKKIVWSPTLGYAKPEPEVLEITEAAVKDLESLGCKVDMIEDLLGEDPIDLWNAEFYAGAGTRLKSALDNSRELLDPAVAETLDLALVQKIDEYYEKVFKRYSFRDQVREIFSEYDLIATPTLPVDAFDAGTNVPTSLPGHSIVSWVYYTYPFNLTGNPAASLPCGFTSAGLPVGLQLISGTNNEADIFRVASAYEATQPTRPLRPNL
jgi:Asp-tRNA(Asn)/Glu-tRNA(Gln) amidotransferase A subunit family amidase